MPAKAGFSRSSSLLIDGLKAGFRGILITPLADYAGRPSDQPAKTSLPSRETCLTSLASLGDKLKPTTSILNQLKISQTA